MQVAARLARTYDPVRLRRDLDSLAGVPDHAQPGPYHDGSWRGIALCALGGRADCLVAGGLGDWRFRPTAALGRTPYLRSVLADLPCPKRAVRILSLGAGGRVEEHDDPELGFPTGFIRLHVPIVTHQDVELVIGGERCDWRPGELWWADFSVRHHVTNRSVESRVHLVIDAWLEPGLEALFPAAVVRERRAAGPMQVGAAGRFARFMGRTLGWR